MSRPAHVTAFVASAWSLANVASQLGRWPPENATAAQHTDASGNARHYVQATDANKPVLTTMAGKPALQCGMVSGVRRYQVATVGTGNVQSHTHFLVCSFIPSDTTVRSILALSATSEAQLQGLAADSSNGGLLSAIGAAAGARVEPCTPYGGVGILTITGTGSARKLYWNDYELDYGASTSNGIGNFTRANSNTPSDAKACPGTYGYELASTAQLTATEIKRVKAGIINAYEGVQLIIQGNSQSSYAHVTSTGQMLPHAVSRFTSCLCYTSFYAVGGKQTPQMLSDFDTQVRPLINYEVKRRIYVMQEGENDIFANARDDVDANNTTYATTTAVTNDKALSTKAALRGAGVIVKVGIPPSTAGTVGGGGGSDTPLNYEASRLANDAYWRANARFVYRPDLGTWTENVSPALDPATGRPFVECFLDAFHTSTAIGSVASTTGAYYDAADHQHLNTSGVALLAQWLAAAVDYLRARMVVV